MRPAPSQHLPVGWTEAIDENGKIYYISEYTLETSCTRPIMPAAYFWLDRSDEVECYHLMVKHAGSRVPSSWRQSVITRTRDEAIALVKKYRAMIVSKQKTFQQVARVVSDCPSARYNGHLGVFRRGAVRHRFVSMVDNLPIGRIAGPIETPSGIHLLVRTR